MTATPATPTDTSARLHGLDTLRATALGLGIVLHSLMPFLPGSFWLVTDAHSSDAALITVEWIHLFRMVVFMALAGYFGRMMLQRRGPGAFLKDRALRIGLPVVAFWPIVVFPLGILATIAAARDGQPALDPTDQAVPDVPEPLLWFVPGHMWFLVVLLQCVLITVAVRAVGLRLLGPDRCERLTQRLGAVLSSPAGVGLAALPYLGALLLQGDAEGGIREPITILPSISALTAYLGAFTVGWFLHAGHGALARLAPRWPLQLGAASVLSVVVFLTDPAQVPLLAHGAVMALAGWTWTFGLIGLCMRVLHRESRVMRYLADSSYWSYLLHLPIVVALGVALAPLDWPILIKLVLTWAVTAVILLVSYDLLVRNTWIGKWLNGRRRPRALRPKPTDHDDSAGLDIRQVKPLDAAGP